LFDAPPDIIGRLSDRFIAPPFSILDTRQDYWQTRKRAWKSLGIKSEIGRATNLMGNGDLYRGQGKWEAHRILKDVEDTGTSIFDPVLAEIAYVWFTPPAGEVLDPFAGGSVRGIVSAVCGRPYTGIDLAAEQLAANEAQADTILTADQPRPVWVHGDSAEVLRGYANDAFDTVFSCPPYYDLEVYGDDPADISNMTYPEFCEVYRRIILHAVRCLKPNRFACWVIGDVRDSEGAYRNLVGETTKAFEDAGARLYNEAILLTAAGTAPMRAAKAFESSRKLCRTHQTMLVFVKGNPRLAADAIGKTEVEERDDQIKLEF
jgi:hypothetical protein